MPKFHTVRRVPFTPEEMFAVVADVEAYPLFLPMCESLSVLRRQECGEETTLVATMGVGYKAIHETFTTRVILRPGDASILVEYLDGPFSHLENRWRFMPAPGGADTDFHIAYEFRSPMLGLLVGSLFDKAFRRFTAAFEERAHAVYGRRELAASAP